MYGRTIEAEFRKSLKKYPVITLIGPRQSGKTTLVQTAFPNFQYVSLEDPDVRLFATEDPRGFFAKYPGSLVLDEVQRIPHLTSYVQTIVDDKKDRRQFILTGSHNLLLMEAVSQSLAGRTRVFELLPLSWQELAKTEKADLNQLLWQGGYPRIYDQRLDPNEWHREYLRLYVERDIRSIVSITDLDRFERFIRLTAGRVGQLANFLNLANESGISQPTAQAWFSALKTTYVCFALQPHFKNFNRRIVKTPKIYFYDTGLLCYLLKIREPEQLDSHPLRGQIFENFVVVEKIKSAFNSGQEPHLYFWRDQKGHEIDLVEDRGNSLYPMEIKNSQTFHPSFVANIKYFNALQKATGKNMGQVIYAGQEPLTFEDYLITPWWKTS